MRLLDVSINDAPNRTAIVRATARISFDSGDVAEVWFECPESLSGGLATSGNPWLIAMLPEAAVRGESIQVELPVDARLVENLRGVTATWCSWYPHMHPVAIIAADQTIVDMPPTRRGAFFSGGIDSYFTIARRAPQEMGSGMPIGKLDELVTVWGFDVGVNDSEGFWPLAEGLQAAARAMKIQHTVVRTNLRLALNEFRRNWGPLTFGAGLAFVATMLERRYGAFYLGSSYSFGQLVPWGSHPLVDPLFSSSGLTIIHDGASFNRFEKTAHVGKFEPAYESLHVCQANGTSNCSDCEKCLRTMVALDVLGLKDQFARVFDWGGYALEKVSRVYIGDGAGTVFFREIEAAAINGNRPEVASAIGRALEVSRRLAPWIALSDKMLKLPYVHRFGDALRARILRNKVSTRYIDHKKSS